MDAQTDLWVDWARYHDLIEDLAGLIDQSHWEFDRILCVSRGGLRVGDVLSRIFKIPMDVVAASSYRANEGRTQEKLFISPSIASVSGELAGRVLLVDDLSDTGHTFLALIDHLKLNYREVTEIRSACVWSKASSVIRPDFVAEHLDGDPWIHQPFELYDNMSLAEFRANRSGKLKQ